MKKMFKDQKGYALIIVLLIIVIIGVMAPVLVGSVLSSAKQNKITEEQIQLNHIADMGLIYFQNQFNMNESTIKSDIQSKVNNSSGKLSSDDISNIINNIKSLTKVPRNVQIDGKKDDYQYTVDITGEITVDPNNFEIDYTSTAKKLSNGKEKVKKDSLTFKISNQDTTNGNNSGNNGTGNNGTGNNGTGNNGTGNNGTGNNGTGNNGTGNNGTGNNGTGNNGTGNNG